MNKLNGLICLSVVAVAAACTGSGNVNMNRNAPAASPQASPSNSAAAPAASGTNNILFIIDASGSMKVKTGSKTKMDAAKEVITQLIEGFPSDVNAGLMAYGHRQKDDCKDVEVLVPVGPLNKALFSQKVNALQPLGQTPISFSIRQAADAMKDVKGKRSIILISDGEETCKDDPCAVVAELKKANIDLKIHVVGFGLDSAAAKHQLHCIAEATGGTFAEAKDAGALKEKIEEVAESELGNFVSVIQDMDGQPLKYGLSFYKPGAKDTDDPIDSTLNLGMQQLDTEHVLNIPPGTYDLRYSALPYISLWNRNVEVKAGEQTRVEFPRFGRLHVSIKDQNGQNVNMWTEVHDGTPDEKDLIGDHRFKETIDLPAGTYDIKFWGGGAPETWQKGVVVTSGQVTPIDLKVAVNN